MHRLLFAALVAVLSIAVCRAPAVAAEPLDPAVPPRLTGWIAPSQGVLGCERYMNKRVTLYPLMCVIKCSIKNATAMVKQKPFSLEECETTDFKACKSQYDRALAKLDDRDCPGCLDDAGQAALYPVFRDVVKTLNGQIYCESENCTPLDDGSGCVSNTRDTALCENKVAANIAKLFKCMTLKCHQRTAEDLFWGKLNPPGNNFKCEDEDPLKSCKVRFIHDMQKLVGCPSCVPDAESLFTTVQQALDSLNGNIYCGQ